MTIQSANAASSRVVYHFDNGRQTSWHDLGSPPEIREVQAPLACAYPISQGIGLSVFVIGNNLKTQRAELYERRLAWKKFSGLPIAACWEKEWRSHGAPPGIAADVRYAMRTSAAWEQGRKTRVSIFGQTMESNSRHGRLLEFDWDGAQWSWSEAHSRPRHKDTQLNVVADSMAALDTPDYGRISVVCRGENGALLERFLEIKNGNPASAWQWRDISE
jgi:hypothetical protein